MNKRPNGLINETSLYLQQHAYNPVNWHPWGDAALQEAKDKDKMILVSIGYSSCHWCHVMERECFENEDVAAVMNEHFICIKVDREERPDIDNIYMTAVQIMSGSGGWPLNCIALPDGRPVWGGTYFRPEKWVEIISGIARYYKNNRAETVKYAEELTRGIAGSSLLPPEPPGRYTIADLKPSVRKLKDNFDAVYGGTNGAPKFPMPVNIDFLLHYGYAEKDKEVLDHVRLTLMKIASGGIYDQAGGGFARYSVDEEWRIPHFEKMLYDNAQMTGLYSDAWLQFREDRFRDVVYHTVAFLEREMMTAEGLLSSSIDADSEGEEGRFYVWTPAEIAALEVDERELFDRYYGIESGRLWDGKYYVLTAPDDEGLFCRNEGLELSRLGRLKGLWRNSMLADRGGRIRPVTDSKVITSWNAMAVEGLVKAFRAFGDEYFLRIAEGIAEKLVRLQLSEDFKLARIRSGEKAGVEGFLDDYSFLLQSVISLYEVTMNEKWLKLAVDLSEHTKDSFFDKSGGMYLFNRRGSDILITNHFETYDNVIPSSNSIMAQNLFRLGHLTGDTALVDLAVSMLGRIADRVTRYPSGYAGWAKLMLWTGLPFYQIAVTGEEAGARLTEIFARYLPGVVMAGTSIPSDRPLFRDRYREGETLIWLCINNSCELPVTGVADLRLPLPPDS